MELTINNAVDFVSDVDSEMIGSGLLSSLYFEKLFMASPFEVNEALNSENIESLL